MKILVTGAAGFIGSHLCGALLKQGHSVTGIDNLNAYYDPALKTARLKHIKDSNPNGRFVFHKTDICEKELLEQLFTESGFETVYHLAAQAGVRYSIDHPEAYIQSNITGFFNLLECCRRYPVRHLIFASSSSIYGNNSSIPYKENDTSDQPVSLYAATKKSNELMAYSYASLYGIPCTGLRFFTVYGAWSRPDMAPFLFLKAIFDGEEISLFNYGDMERDFTYIDDVIEGMLQILPIPPVKGAENNATYRVLNIGNSNPIKLNDFVSVLEEVAGIKAKKSLAPMQPGDVKATWADVSALQHLTGYTPATPIKKGLSVFVEWYKSYYLC